jgi:hypothetical protein
MTVCAKCNAELIGAAKFCAACGTPVFDPRATGRNLNQQSPLPADPPKTSRDSMYNAPPPVSNVNPFAQTALPGKRESYGPPAGPLPAAGMPPAGAVDLPPISAIGGAAVSPLAVSNVVSQRGAAQQAMADARAASGAPASSPNPGVPSTTSPSPGAGAPAPKPKAPGTQLLPSMANPPVASTGAPAPSTVGAPAPSAARRGPAGTEVLSAVQPSQIAPSATGSAPSGAGAPSAAGSAPGNPGGSPMHGAPGSSPGAAGAYGAPPPPTGAPAPVPSGPPGTPNPNPYPPYPGASGAPPNASPYPQAYPGAAPPTPGWGWNASAPPPAQPAQYGYGFSYAPGSRVSVTWSDGRRYPGTIQHVSGTQCLVVFPDGQQHWVPMQVVAPA